MPRFSSNRSRSALAAALLLVLASLALAACGSSSSASPSASTSSAATTGANGATAASSASGGASSTTTATTTKATTKGFAGASKRFLAVRECLQKSGVVLPRKPGQQSPGAGFLAGGVPQLPKGVTPAQYQAAIRKCGGLPPGGRFGGAGNRLKSGAFRQTLAKFADCLRENGVNIPAPNTSGKGPIFNTRGVNVASAKFKAARLKCASVLRSGLVPAPGAASGAPTPAG
jgi:hypothetical protein